MKVLVTGGAGFVGSVLCRDLLDLGHKVICLDSLQKGDGDSLLGIVANKNFEFVHDTILSDNLQKVVNKVEAVIHLAALVGAPKCKKDPELSYITNYVGTKKLISCLSSQRLIFASTGSIYGRVDGICTEESSINPQSEYGKDKKMAEDLVTNYHNSISFRFATGCGVSPCMRVNLLVNNLVYDAVHKRSISLFEPDAKRTFISVQDMSRCFIHALERQGAYKVYNAGDNSMNASKREMAEIIRSKIPCEVFYGQYLKDPDKRDYAVDYSRLNDYESFGFKCRDNINKVIDDLIKSVALLNVEGRYA